MGYWKYERLVTGRPKKRKSRKVVKVGKSPTTGKMLYAVYKKK